MRNCCYQFAMWLGACVMLASSASAQINPPLVPPTVPPQCTAPRDTNGYNVSVRAGKSRIDSVWNSTAVNHDLDLLGQQVDFLKNEMATNLGNMLNSMTATTYVKCRAQGYADGFLYRLAQLLQQCVIDGADIGQMSAKYYCDIAIANGDIADQGLFLRTPAGVCGQNFERTCDEVYQWVGTEGSHMIAQDVQDYLNASSFSPTQVSGCKIYTENAYAATFAHAYGIDCAYLP